MNGGPPAGTLQWLDDIRAGDRAAVGGKAYVLALLRQAGLPVPNGFVVPPAFRDDDALARACASLGGPFAVRSSAASEDGADASFAGQFRTELDVTGADAVRAAVDRCRAAVGLGARLRAGDGDRVRRRGRGARPAVRRAPRRRRDLHPPSAGSLRDAGRGARGARRRAGLGAASPPIGTPSTAPPRAVRDGAGRSLGPSDLAAVAALAVRAEAHLGAPQDVEWAIGPDGPVLLQARPITVAAEAPLDPRVRHLTRANVGEVLPGPVTPLTATSVLAFLEHGFRTVAGDAGLLPDGAPPFLVVHEQHVYLNLTLCREIVTHLPGVSAADAERLVFGGGGPAAAAASPTGAGPR